MFWLALALLAGGGPAQARDRADAAVSRKSEPMMVALEAADARPGAAIYIRITKRPAELVVFAETPQGRYARVGAWPVCAFSGGLGPKLKEGDGKSPEGFYSVSPDQMNPASAYHLSFNLGFPNAYDRAHGRTGSFLMVHGQCVSIGCYAMTDDAIEEIWTLMQMAFAGGQDEIAVHVFPFAMPDGVLPEAYAGATEAAFWTELAPAWAAFEASARPPQIRVRDGAYVVGR